MVYRENPYNSMNSNNEAPLSQSNMSPYNNTQNVAPAMSNGKTPALSPSMTPAMAPGKSQAMMPSMSPPMSPSMGHPTTLPTGIPSGTPYGGATIAAAGPTPSMVQTPQTVQNPYYTAGFLKKFIGREVRIEFLIGTGGTLIDRIGTLLDVGASYIVIRPLRSNDSLMCDLYSIKFVTIYA